MTQPLQFLDVPDPVYGVLMGKLPFFAGWQGTASVLRNDAFNPDTNSISLEMASPDQQARIATYSQGLHTGLHQNPGQGGHYALTRFTSTGDLITRYLLPTLNLNAPHSAPRPSFTPQTDAALAEVRRLPFGPGAFAQAAAVTVSADHSGVETVLEAITIGFFLGTPTESTVTHFTILQAPAGQAEPLARDWESLPPMVLNPVWRQLNDEHLMAVLQRMQQRQQIQQNAEIHQWMQSYSAKQDAFNQWQRSRNDNARGMQQARADQSLINARQDQQFITDTGNQIIDARNGNSRFYAFCNDQTGDVVYQYNSTVPPDSSGHWHRCGND